jgi:acetyltransferase
VVREVAEAYEGETTLMAVFMQVTEASEYLRGESTTVPVYQFPEDAAVALEKAVRYGEWLQADPGEVPKMDRIENEKAKRLVAKAMSRVGPDGGWLEPGEVTELLGLHGIRVPAEAVVTSEDAAVAAAAEMGGPVVLKVIAESALHKSDSGGIALDLETEEEVREAYRVVSTAVDDVDGVLVQEMIRGGHEVLVGVTEDPNFGPLIVYGLGGIMVEVMQDVTFKLWPITDVDAGQMVDGIRGAKLLRGYRNLPKGDIEGVQDILLRVSAMVGICPEIVEMDLNPVKVLEPGQGVVAVDARIRVRPANPGAALELADLPAVVNARPPRQADSHSDAG